MIFCFGSNPYDAYLGEVAQPLNTSGVLVTRKRKRLRPCRCWRVWPALIRGGFKALDIAGSCWGEHEHWVRWFMLVSGCFQHFSIGHPVSAVIWTLSQKFVRAADLFSRARHLADGEYDPPQHPTLDFLFLGEGSTWNSSVCRDM